MNEDLICGKPVTSFPTEERVGLPIYPGGVVVLGFCTVCLLPPNHEGECKDAKYVPGDQGLGEYQ